MSASGEGGAGGEARRGAHAELGAHAERGADGGTGGAWTCGPGGRYRVLEPGTDTVPDGGDPGTDAVPDGGCTFNPTGTGRVRDTTTGLVWNRFPLSVNAAVTHGEVESACQAQGGRLPTLGEALAISGADFDSCAWPCPWMTDTSTVVGQTNVGAVTTLIDSTGTRSIWADGYNTWYPGLCVR